MRVIVCSNEQFAGIGESCRRGIERHITIQHVDSLIEVTTTLLIEQFSIVKQSILCYGLIIFGTRRHSKRVHGIGLVASTQVAIGQVVRCILCKHIVRTTRLTQMWQRIRIESLTIERVAYNIVLQAAHLAACRAVGIHILHSRSIVIQLKPRLGHNATYLLCLLLGCALHQGITLRHDGTVVAILKIDLHQIEGHQITIYGALRQHLKTLSRSIQITLGIGHI